LNIESFRYNDATNDLAFAEVEEEDEGTADNIDDEIA